MSEDLRSAVKAHFEAIAPKYDRYKNRRDTYHQALKELAREVFPDAASQTALDIGCGTGEVLASLGAKRALGMDFSLGMVQAAQGKFPPMGLFQGEGERLPLADGLPVDIVLSMDTLEHFHSPHEAIREIARISGPQTRILLSWANPLWEPLLHLFEALGLKMPEGPHRWPGLDEIKAACAENHLFIEQEGHRLLIPGNLGPLSRWPNQVFHTVPGVRRLGLIQFLALAKAPSP